VQGSVQVYSRCALSFVTCMYKCISVMQVRYNHCEKLRRMDRNNPSHSHRTFGLPPSARGCSVGGQFKPYYLGHPSPSSFPTTMSSQHHSSSPNLVGGHYRVGRKIGEGSFGVIFEGLFFSLSLPFPGLSSNLDSFFRDRDEPSQLSDRRHQICQSTLASVLARGPVHRPDPIPHTGTSEGRSPPAER